MYADVSFAGNNFQLTAFVLGGGDLGFFLSISRAYRMGISGEKITRLLRESLLDGRASKRAQDRAAPRMHTSNTERRVAS